MAFAAGQRLGRYVIGAAAPSLPRESYYATRNGTGEKVTVRILAQVSADAAMLQELARRLRAFRHPNVAAVEEIEFSGNFVYVVSEHTEGESLRERLKQGAPPNHRTITIAADIARAMAAANRAGFLHCDLRPENILLGKDGHVKVIGFGLADLIYPEGSVPQVVDYASPEQVRGEEETARSDIFSFGVVVYEMAAGTRPFLRNTAAATTHAILEDRVQELPARATPALDRIVRRCLHKEPDQRFESPNDLAFAIESLGGLTVQTGAKRELSHRHRSTPMLLASLAAAILGTLAGATVARRYLRPIASSPLLYRTLSSSGRDFAPAAAPDGKTIAFTSTRDGTPRIWSMDIESGREGPLTSGPDSDPRFSPDGKSLLFIRGGRDLMAGTAQGGGVRRLLENVQEADWSPDGRSIVWVRQSAQGSMLGHLNVSGGGEWIISKAEDSAWRHPRWAPDSLRVAAVAVARKNGLASVAVTRIEEGSQPYSLTPPLRPSYVSGVSWSADGENLFYYQTQTGARAEGWPDGTAMLIRQNAKTGAAVGLGFSSQGARVVDTIGPGRLVFDGSSGRQNLVETTHGTGEGRVLTWGAGENDPAYTPDASAVYFTSYRGGGLGVWKWARGTGAVTRVTEERSGNAQPWVSADGKRLLWSSNRDGHLEIYSAGPDGENPRLVTHDGAGAEWPSMPDDGSWVVYLSLNPTRGGIWKVRQSGIEDTRVMPTEARWPEVSPDGRYVLYTTGYMGTRTIRVVGLEDGLAVPFEIAVDANNPDDVVGRAHWAAQGHAIAFIATDGRGRSGIYGQEFAPGRDTRATRREAGGFDATHRMESFAISRDGASVTTAAWEALTGVGEVINVLGAGRQR